ncbi:hypothetical protein AQ938_06750 [Burkholderia pseudomallei]|uniref:hypothetical protein n=1 Tax=Burkholderia pseudomallei TaxID=28450 RepID=UPI0009D465D8|nr:hypothetical protein [Burkholderia pseudomallei]OND78974.1 hypothetical protein AQ938_06750 [Burkholderia pseudomallei]
MDSNHDIVPTLRMFDGVMTGLAADEIERLRKRVAELEADAEAEAREPITKERVEALIAEHYDTGDGDTEAPWVDVPGLAAAIMALVSTPADAGEAVAHMRVRSTDAGSTSHAIDIAPEAVALDLKPGEYLLYLAPPTTRAAHLTTTLSPDQRISMAAKLFFFANELLNGADQS